MHERRAAGFTSGSSPSLYGECKAPVRGSLGSATRGKFGELMTPEEQTPTVVWANTLSVGTFVEKSSKMLKNLIGCLRHADDGPHSTPPDPRCCAVNVPAPSDGAGFNSPSIVSTIRSFDRARKPPNPDAARRPWKSTRPSPAVR